MTTARWGMTALLISLAACAAAFPFGFTVTAKILTFLGLALTLAGAARPGAGLLGVGLLSALDSFSRTLVFDAPLPWNLFGYVLLAMFLAFLPRELPRMKGLPLATGALFAAFLFIELVPGAMRVDGVQHIFGLFSLYCLYVFCDRAAPDRDAWLWLGIVVGTVGAVGGLAYVSQANIFERVNKNAWAYLPLTGLFVLVPAVSVAGQRRGVRILLMLLAAGDATVVFLSESRGTFLVAALLLAWVLMAGTDSAAQRVARIGAALVALVPVVVVLSLTFREETAEMSDRLGILTDTSRSVANRTSGRSELARIGLAIAKEHPLGIGTGLFADVAADYGTKESIEVFHNGRELQAHSAWVKTLAENGFPGLLLFVAFVASFAISGWHRRERGLVGLGLLGSAVLAIAFVSTEFQAKGIWLFAAIVAVILERGRARAAAPQPAEAPSEARPEETAWRQAG